MKAGVCLVGFCVLVTWLVVGGVRREVLTVMLTGVSLVIFPFLLNFKFNPEYQIQRRLLHMFTGSLIVYLSSILDVKILYLSLFMLTLGSAVIEVSRRRIPAAARLFGFFFGNLLRPEEAKGRRIPGAFYFLPGAGVCLLLFPTEVARLGILALAYGDPAAGFFGAFKRRTNFRIYGKSLFGFLACAVVAGAACVAYEALAGAPSTGASALWRFAKYGMLAGVAETVAVLDDNLTMPSVFCLLLEFLCCCVYI